MTTVDRAEPSPALSAERPPWLVRIRRPGERSPSGAGVLVSDRHVLTCAHVLAAQPGPEPPGSSHVVEFQYVPTAEPLTATTVEGGWYPEAEHGTGDVAILILDGAPPAGARAAPMRSTEIGVWDHSFRAYGYPRGHEDEGVPTRGNVVGAAGREWLQLQAEPNAFALEGGFSGSPIWDLQLDAVIGIVVARDKRRPEEDLRTAYGIPAEVVARHWPSLALLNTTTGRSIVVRADAPRAVAEAAEALDDPYWKTRRNAVSTLGGTDHPSSVEVLHAALTHPVLTVRAEVSELLAYKDDVAAIPTLISLLEDDDHSTDSLDGLISLGEPATPSLLATLLNDSEAFVRRHLCAIALVRIGVEMDTVTTRWVGARAADSEESRFRSGYSRSLTPYREHAMRTDVAAALEQLSEAEVAPIDGLSLEEEWWVASYLPDLTAMAASLSARLLPVPVLVDHPDGPDLALTPLLAATERPDAGAVQAAVEAQVAAGTAEEDEEEEDDDGETSEGGDVILRIDLELLASAVRHRTLAETARSEQSRSLLAVGIACAMAAVGIAVLVVSDRGDLARGAVTGFMVLGAVLTALLLRWATLSAGALAASESRAAAIAQGSEDEGDDAPTAEAGSAAQARLQQAMLGVVLVAWIAAAIYAIVR